MTEDRSTGPKPNKKPLFHPVGNRSKPLITADIWKITHIFFLIEGYQEPFFSLLISSLDSPMEYHEECLITAKLEALGSHLLNHIVCIL